MTRILPSGATATLAMIFGLIKININGKTQRQFLGTELVALNPLNGVEFDVEIENVTDPGTAPEGRPTLDGTVSLVTFLGSGVVYQVALDWMTIEVRAENRPSIARRDVGDEVSLWWRDDAVAVVSG